MQINLRAERDNKSLIFIEVKNDNFGDHFRTT